MKVSVCFTFLLLVCCLFLFAEVEEIPELDTENLEDNWLNLLYSEIEDGKYNFGLNNRLKYSENCLTNIRVQQKELCLNLNLYFKESSELDANFQLSRLPSKNNRSEIYFGSYRPAFGLGTVLKKSGEKTLFTVNRPAHPVYYSPFGAATIVRINSVSLFFMGSGRKRNASLKENKINSLYKTIHSESPVVQENILAGGLEYQMNNSQFGILAYEQNYDRNFVDSLMAKKMQVYAFSTKMNRENITIATELAYLEKDLALQTTSQFSYHNIAQEISYAYRQGNQLPVYAAKPYLLSSKGESQEINWNLNYQPHKIVYLDLRYALIRKNNCLKSPVWNSRSIINLSLKPSSTAINLQLTRLDKEIISENDSSYITTLPVHYRFRLKVRQELNENMDFTLLCRYHYEDKMELHKNSFYWENAFRYSQKRVAISTGIKTWQTLNMLIIPDEYTENPSGTIATASDENIFFIVLSYKGNLFQCKTEMQQSWLNGNRSLYFSISI
ncbi:MAG: hypothetical protein PHR67_02965 [Candidatus Cloacimonetes bacterium]|nr:hypothetical protein [Candidatus Cloacimonas sp.]MDD2250339.1 hypothetical protein [Candidatus Cloacimonadota bacterium]MDD3733848.1 hypothetical protein [Candidatus Cloacimonadota bacterium]MDD4676602.1 hypothetical protein [Candidatus Cloacimonadota bacterium]